MRRFFIRLLSCDFDLFGIGQLSVVLCQFYLRWRPELVPVDDRSLADLPEKRQVFDVTPIVINSLRFQNQQITQLVAATDH